MIQYLYIFTIIVAYCCLSILSYDILWATLYYANPINNAIKFPLISKQLNITIGLIFFYSLGFIVAGNAPLHDSMVLIITPFIVISIALVIVSYFCFHIKQQWIIKHTPLISKSFNIKLINPILISLVIVWCGYISNSLISNLYNTISIKTQEFIQQKKTSLYTIELDKDLMIVTIPQFTVGIVGFNEVDWGKLNIVEVVDDMYNTLKANSPNSNVQIYISLYSHNEDRYGNKYRSYRLYDLMSVNTSEVKKYKNGYFFERDYNIISQIRRLPFDKNPIKEITKNEKDY